MAGKKSNALKHGANAKEVMLWSERYEDYESLRAEIFLEFSPSGSTEEYLVQMLVDLRWRRQRLDCFDKVKIQKRLDQIRLNNAISRGTENLSALASEFKQADSAEKVEAILARIDPAYSKAILSRFSLETGADPAAWGAKIAEALARMKPDARYEGPDEFVEVFDLETFDQHLARIERLDAMIDRTLKRLMQVKTMKQMHSRLEPKLINVSALENPAAQNGREVHSSG